MAQGPKQQFSAISFIFLTIFIDRFGESLIFPLLPFLVEPFGFDAFSLGLLVSSFAAAQFFAAPILGSLSDHYGRRPILLICVFGTGVANLIFAGATRAPFLFGARALDGATGGVASTAQAYISDIAAPQDRAKLFGITGAAFGLGFIFGPALGGVLATISLTLPVFVAAGVAFLNCIFGYFTLPESLPKEQRRALKLQDFNPFQSLTYLWGGRGIRSLLGAFFSFSLAFSAFTSVYILFLNAQFDWGPTQAAIVFVIIGVISTLVQGGLIRILLRHIKEMQLCLYGFLCLILGLTFVLITPKVHPWPYIGLYSSAIAIAFGFGLVLPALRALICNQVSDQEQGQILGSSQALQSIAAVLGPTWAGWTFDQVSQNAPFSQSILLFALAAFLILFNRRHYLAAAKTP